MRKTKKFVNGFVRWNAFNSGTGESVSFGYPEGMTDLMKMSYNPRLNTYEFFRFRPLGPISNCVKNPLRPPTHLSGEESKGILKCFLPQIWIVKRFG